jgi:phosphoribosyl 1,2-cyclic phosphodiesterase
MMRVASLGSGSKGNATLIQVGSETYLVDCGFGLKEVESRLQARGLHPGDINGIFVTHEHGDHIKGTPMLANKYGIPLYASFGTARHLKRDVPTLAKFLPNHKLSIGLVEVEPVTVPHDSAEPTQFVFRHQGLSVGILTDLGSLTKRVQDAFSQCQLLMLECNHDPIMLSQGPYPPNLKRRVGGNFGHLSNEQAAQMLEMMNRSRLSHVLVSHISEQNNDPNLAMDTILPKLDGYSTATEVLTQDEGCDWITIRYHAS